MIEILNEQINLKKLEATDIIEVDVLQKFLDNFALGMNCAAVSVDRTGNEITNPSYYREFCSKYIHGCASGDRECANCHNRFGEEATKSKKPYVGRCHAGMIDFSAPIIVKGEHLGTVLGGQILDKAPTENEIKSVARNLGIDEDKLWNAATKISIVPMKNISAAAEVLFIVVNTLAENGFNRLEMETLSNHLADNFMQISKTVEMLAESAQDITYNQNALTVKIKEVNDVTIEISNILKSISSIAGRTKLIGLNASIESARLGNDGRGFAVVANEIRSLAEKSNVTVMEVNKLNEQINHKIDSTLQDANNTLGSTEDQSAAMEELSATVQNSVILAERLKALCM